MPIYVYRCTRCCGEHEEQRKVDDRAKPAVCPECKSEAHQIPALVAPQFPGADRWR